MIIQATLHFLNRILLTIRFLIATRPIDIAKHLKAHPHLDVDASHELIIDMPESITDIAIRNIVGRFNLLFCNESQSPAQELKTMVSRKDMYVCRYKIVRLNGKYCLLPWTSNAVTIPAADAVRTPLKSVAGSEKENTPQKNDVGGNKRKITVTPIKIVNNSVQKVSPRGRHSQYIGRDASPAHSDQEMVADDGESDSSTPRKRSKQFSSSNNNNNNSNYNSPKPSACKNLNVSLGGTVGGESQDDLNYSIEQQDTLKVKIKISDRQR